MNNAKIAIFDLDGTLIDCQSQQLFLGYLKKRKIVGLIPYLRIMYWFVLYKLGFLNDPAAIMNYAFSFLKGMKEGEMGKLAHDFFASTLERHVYPEARDLIRQHQAEGHAILLVSNALEPIVVEVGRYFGVPPEDCLATRLEKAGDIYTGKIKGVMLYSGHKVSAIRSLWQASGFAPEETWGYSDHHSDLAMLELADHPYAVNPDASLNAIARARQWPALHFKRLA